MEFAPENIVVATGINELKSSFRALYLTVLVYTKKTIQLHVEVSGGCLPSRFGYFPTQATSASVNS